GEPLREKCRGESPQAAYGWAAPDIGSAASWTLGPRPDRPRDRAQAAQRRGFAGLVGARPGPGPAGSQAGPGRPADRSLVAPLLLLPTARRVRSISPARRERYVRTGGPERGRPSGGPRPSEHIKGNGHWQ